MHTNDKIEAKTRPRYLPPCAIATKVNCNRTRNRLCFHRNFVEMLPKKRHTSDIVRSRFFNLTGVLGNHVAYLSRTKFENV